MTHENQKLDVIDITERIQHLLHEIRIILPGTEVLFGFLLIAVFSEGFDSLEPLLKYMHLASLGSVAITTILLLLLLHMIGLLSSVKTSKGFTRLRPG